MGYELELRSPKILNIALSLLEVKKQLASQKEFWKQFKSYDKAISERHNLKYFRISYWEDLTSMAEWKNIVS